MSILFADGFDTYSHAADAAFGSPDNFYRTCHGIESAGYASPSTVSNPVYSHVNNNMRAAGVVTGRGRNGKPCVYMIGDFNAYLTTPDEVKYLFRYVDAYEKRIILNTSFKFDVYNPQITGYHIDLIHLGPDAILSGIHSYIGGTGAFQLHLHINNQPTGFYIDQRTWTCVEFEVDHEENKIFLHVNGKKAGEQPYTGGTVRYAHLKPIRSSYGVTVCCVRLDVESFILIDGSGDVNNTRMGKLGVSAVRPNVTHEQGFSPVGAATNHGCVANNDASFETNYVKASDTGAQDLYGTSVAINTIDVKAVTLLTTARRSEADYLELHPVLKQGEDVTVYPHFDLKASEWKTARNTLQKNPATGLPWTPADVQSLQWGQRIGKLYSDAYADGEASYVFVADGDTLVIYRKPNT